MNVSFLSVMAMHCSHQQTVYSHCALQTWSLCWSTLWRRDLSCTQQPLLFSHSDTSGVWLAPFLCLQGNKTVTVEEVKQPPVNLKALIAGEKYHLRVYSQELNSVSSKSVTFKTKAGERRAAFRPVGWSRCLSVSVVSKVAQWKLGELAWLLFLTW